MTSQLPAPQPMAHAANQVVAVGTLDRQSRYGRETTRIDTRNELRGHEQQVVIQVPSPFGQVFALPLRLDGMVEGAGLLEQARVGAPLLAAGRLEWRQRAERRDTHAGVSAPTGELTFRVSAVRLPSAEEQPGCDVWLVGTVISPARVVRHPQRRSLTLAQTTLHVTVERGRRGSRARIVETERVPVVVPLGHPDAPNLLRPGNQVIVEGMLERVLVQRRGPEVDQALAALDAEWHALRESLASHSDELRAAERRYNGRRRALAEAIHSRVVAGYIELVCGSPATLREAQRLRQAEVHERRRRDALGHRAGAE
jgi:hypothetical protein